MKTRLLRRLRRKARKNIEITCNCFGFYFFNSYLLRSYSPRTKYDDWPWFTSTSTKYCETIEEVRKDYKYVLWSETWRLFDKYKEKIKIKEREKELKTLKNKL